MNASTTCTNQRCTCTPCVCGDCRYAGAKLGELERRVMEIIWEEPGRDMSCREVADSLPDYAYTTVATVLDRLSRKGLLRRMPEGRIFRYAPTETGGAYTARAMYEALARTSDRKAALTRFAETVSRSEASVLRRVLGKVSHNKSS